MEWKEFLKKGVEDLFEGNPAVQLFLKDGTCAQGRLMDVDPFIVLESDMRADEPKPTGRVWVVRSDEMMALKLIIPDMMPDTWDGFDEAMREPV